MSRQGPAGSYRIQPTYGQDPYGTFKANDQTPMPTSIKCIFCNIEKQPDAFSKTQLSKLTYNPFAPPGWNKRQQPKQIVCKQCTAKQQMTLTCMTCTKTKPLDKFAKNQRRHAERARCFICMKKREDEDVDDSEPDSEDSDDGPMNETWHDLV